MPAPSHPERPTALASRRHPASVAGGVVTAVLLAAGGCGMMDSIPRGAESISAAWSGPTPSQAAEMALDQYNADNRFRGIQLLSNADFGGNDPYVQLYLDALDDEDAGVRWVGVRALGRHGDPAHVGLILERLLDSDAQVRAESARALQRLHDPSAVEPLVRAMDPEFESEVIVRAEAAHALGQYRQARVVQSLIARLDDASLAVNRNTLASLRTLTGQDFGLDRRAWLAWVDRSEDLFAGGTPYTYPVFSRDKSLIEWLPFVPPPPNESESTPVGMPPGG